MIITSNDKEKRNRKRKGSAEGKNAKSGGKVSK